MPVFILDRQEDQNIQAAVDMSLTKTEKNSEPSQPNKIQEIPPKEEKENPDHDFPLLNGASADAKITQSSSPKVSPKPTRKPETVYKKTRAIDSLEDFPSLGKTSKTQQRKPPPGFANVVKKEPEVSQVKPPPGLQVNVSSSQAVQQKSNTSELPIDIPNSRQSSARSKSIILLKEEPTVITESKDNQLEAKNAQSRNQTLIENIKSLLDYDRNKFVEFKTLSGKFRQGLCTAEAYYVDCTALFGMNFGFIFNELVTLLPDQAKQKELLRIHNDSKVLDKKSGKPSQQSTGKRMKPPSTTWGPLQNNPSNPAPVKKEALNKSRNEVDFPSLPSAAPRQMKSAQFYKPRSNLSLKTAWVRGK
jgi:hypothetical protein